MRDGTVLRADVYFPTSGGQAAVGRFPVIVAETPYDRQLASLGAAGQLVTGYSPYLIKRGYIQAVVDVRGTGNSGGVFSLFGPQETADSVEVIRWASRLPGSNGKVGMTGESYGGIVQLFAAAAVGRNSALKAIFPITAAHNIYREFASSGGVMNFETGLAGAALYGSLALLEPLSYVHLSPNALSLTGQHAASLKSFSAAILIDYVRSGDRMYDGPYWHQREPGRVLSNIVRNEVPAYLVDGLADIYQEGAPLNFAGLQNAWASRPVHGPMRPGQRTTGRYQLLLKPTYHFDVSINPADLDPIKLAWFDRWLKGQKTGIDRVSKPMHVVHPTGERRAFAIYPAVQPTAYFLGSGHKLARAKPAASAGADKIVFTGASLPCDRSTNQWALGGIGPVFTMLRVPDPCAGPVPTMVGPGRLDYTTQSFDRDTDIAGPIAATLYARANTTDTEWVIQLADVSPNGVVTDLTQGAHLGSFRALDSRRTWRTDDGAVWLPYHPFTRSSVRAVTRGALTRYDIVVRPMFATLRSGHRLRLTITTSQTPHLLPTPAQLANLMGGIYEVQRNASAPSVIRVPLRPSPSSKD